MPTRTSNRHPDNSLDRKPPGPNSGNNLRRAAPRAGPVRRVFSTRISVILLCPVVCLARQRVLETVSGLSDDLIHISVFRYPDGAQQITSSVGDGGDKPGPSVDRPGKHALAGPRLNRQATLPAQTLLELRELVVLPRLRSDPGPSGANRSRGVRPDLC
jgi:hypothetical protein